MRKAITAIILMLVTALGLGGCAKQGAVKATADVTEALSSHTIRIFVVEMEHGDAIKSVKGSYAALVSPTLKVQNGDQEVAAHIIGETNFAKVIKNGDELIIRWSDLKAFTAQFASAEYNERGEAERLSLTGVKAIKANPTIRALPGKPDSINRSQTGPHWALIRK